MKPDLALALYPNPNSGVLYIKSNDEAIMSANCVIRTLDGKIVYEGNIHFTKGLDLSNLSLSSGVYIVELQFEHGGEIIMQNKKLIYMK